MDIYFMGCIHLIYVRERSRERERIYNKRAKKNNTAIYFSFVDYIITFDLPDM